MKNARRYRPNKANFIVILLLTYVFVSFLTLNPYEVSSLELKNSKNAKEDDTFSIIKFSPYLTDDATGTFTISSESNDFSEVKISFLKATNTRSELFNFADKPSYKNVVSTIAISRESFLNSTPQSKNNLETTFVINSPDATITNSIKLPKTGIYPVAIELIDSTKKTLATKYVFTNYFSGIAYSAQAYSEKLNIVPIIKTSHTYEEEKLFDINNKLSEVGKKQQSSLASLSNELKNILALDVKKTLSINGQLIDNSLLINSNSDNPFIPGDAPQNTQYIADTYAPLNIVALENIGEKSLFTLALSKSRSSLLSNEIDAPSRTLITKSISGSTLGDVSNAGIDQLIVDDKTFEPKYSFGLKPIKISKNNSTISIATYTTDYTEHMDNSNIELKSNFLNAYSSVVALEAPSNKRALIMPLDISTIKTEEVSAFLASLSSNPISTSLTVDEMFITIEPNKQIPSKLEKADFGYISKDTYDKNTFKSLKKYKDTNISLFGQDSIDGKITTSIFFGTLNTNVTNEKMKQEILKLKSLGDNVKSYVSLPSKRTITLTSSKSSIPVTIKNTSNKKINVNIKLESDKLLFDETDTFQTELAGLNTTVNMPIRIRTTGSFPIEIQMTSVDNGVLLASQKVTIRSTSFSGVGLAILIGSFFFLLVWWVTNAKKNRKKLPGDIIDLHKEKLA
jgi:hypothetical protein